jgi:hypothetical protein
MNNVYLKYDLIKLGLCNYDDIEEIKKISKKYSVKTILDGKSVTSREKKSNSKIPVDIVFGDIISKKLPWFRKLYKNQLKDFASEISGIPMVHSSSIKSSININTLIGEGARYEWHVDSNPVTGLLFVSTHSKGEGGELIFRLDNEDVVVYPQVGLFIAFDAREIPHTVMPLMENGKRVSVPMNFYVKGKPQIRPDDLDDYLEKK